MMCMQTFVADDHPLHILLTSYVKIKKLRRPQTMIFHISALQEENLFMQICTHSRKA